MNKMKYLKDSNRSNDGYKIVNGMYIPNKYCNSKIEFFNSETGERIYEPLTNKTVIAGSALTAQKLFGLSHNVLQNTPTYDEMLDLDDKALPNSIPSIEVINDGKVVGELPDECQRVICGFCVGQGGAGLDISDVYDVKYCDYIREDDLVPFRYPLRAVDNVDENMYKGKKSLPPLQNGQERNAYYFKSFSNTPNLVQCVTSNVGTFADNISKNTVYETKLGDNAQSYVELHLKITKDDCREFFIAHTGLENAKINQISLVSAWSRTITVNKLNSKGSMVEKEYEYLQDIRPFSLLNIPNEILSDVDKSISIIYTLYF